MATSDLIARFILDALEQADGIAEMQRVELAKNFDCVPSQINYVISTRFSPEHGYHVESRRGGGGYIRITRVRPEPGRLLMHMVNAAGESLSLRVAAAFIQNALDAGALDRQHAGLILTAVGNNALRTVDPDMRDTVRASIFKQMLIFTISE